MRARPAILGGGPRFPDGLPLVRPWIPDPAGLSRRLGDVLASGILTNGPTVRRLEEELAGRLGVTHAVAVSNCTSGLMLVLQAVGARGRVVMPSFTFSASAHAVVWAGGTPDFVDVDPDTCLLDPERAAEAVRGAVAMTATHLYGAPCPVESLQSVADAADVPLVYDAAHALGSRRRGAPVGGFGTAEVFSLSPTKVVVAAEGGVVTTDDDGVADACRLGRDYGNPGDYDCRFPGLNARMSELHAVTALASLAVLDEAVARRNELVERFASATAGVPGLRIVRPDDGDTSTYKDLTVDVDAARFGLDSTQLAAALRADGIDSRHYYRPPIHRQQAYAAGWGERRPLPVTEALSRRVLSPPLWSHMTDDQIDGVADAVVAVHEAAADVAAALGPEGAGGTIQGPPPSRGA